MKKYLAILLVIALLCGALAGCGSAAGSAAASSAPVSDAEPASEAAEAAEPETTEQVEPAAEAVPEAEASAETVAEEPEDENPEEEAPAPAITKYGIEFATENGNLAEAEQFDVTLPVTDSDEVYTLYMIFSPAVIGNINQLADENIAWKEFCERTGLNLDIHLVHPGNKATEVSLMMASRDYYDIMQDVVGGYTGGVDQAIADEFVYDLTDMLPEVAPNYWSKITYGKESYENICSETGKIVGFARISNALQPENGNAIRGDWLEELGLETPSTIDELHDVLSAFRDDKGTDSAMWLPGIASYETMDILSAYNGSSDFYVKDGVVGFGPIEDSYRDYLTLMAQWYQEGLIYKDFYTNTDDLRVEDIALVAEKNMGVVSTEVMKMAALNNMVEGSRWVAMGAVTQNPGDILHTGGTKAFYMEMIDMAITTACDDPETVSAAFDYLYTDEGSLLANYGVEGETFEFDSDGNPQFTEMMTSDPDSDLKTMMMLNCFDIGPYAKDVYRTAPTMTEDQNAAYEIWYNPETNDQAWNMPNHVSLNADESTEYAGYYAEFHSYFLETVDQFIIGSKSIEDEWDDYVDTMNELGITKSIELYQAAYDRYIGA